MADVKLSPNERRVVELLAQGKSSEQVAQELQISLSTLVRHLENIAVMVASTHEGTTPKR
jgi:DNA-binding CsgD family transcriptional regulator